MNNSLKSQCEVLVSGTFNVVHAGHCELFEFANKYGRVTVGLNAQKYVGRKYKSHAVPLINRAFVLRCNRFVEEVVVFLEEHPGKLIRRLKPSYYVRGPDYAGSELPEQDALDEVGAKVIICRKPKIGSSTQLVKQLPNDVFLPSFGEPEAVVDLKRGVKTFPQLLSLDP